MSTRKKTTILVAALLLTLAAFASPSNAQSYCMAFSHFVFPEVAQVGDIVTYEICVYNCGDVPLIDVMVENPLLGLSETIPILVPDEEWCVSIEYEIQPDDPDPLVSEACVSVVNVFDPACLQTMVDLVEPCIDVEKSVIEVFDDIVTYEICVFNCGDTMLMDIIVDDPQLGLFDIIPILLPGEFWCEYYEYVIQPDDPDPLVNEVLVFGMDEFGYPVEDFDDAVVFVPCLEVEKSVFPEIARVGDIVTYEICVTNCGGTPLLEITVEDIQIGYFFFIPMLMPGETWCDTFEYEIQLSDPDPLINEVWALGWAELFYPVEDFDYAVVDLEEVGTVAIDIKPMSCPNPVNVESKGVLPVAILGTEDLDVMEVDLSSLELRRSDHPEYATPVKIEYDDVATPFDGELCNCHEEGSDGILDLVLHFDTQEVVAALGPVVDGDELILTLTGEVIDGNPIEGSDCIRIIKKGKDKKDKDRLKTVKTAVIVDDSSYTVADAEISTVVELASTWLFTLSGARMELHSIDHVPSITGSKSAFIDNWYLTHSTDPPHFIVILSHDESSASHGGYAITSSVLPGFCNDFNSPVFGNGRIYGAVIDWNHRFAACGYDLEHYKETGNWVVVDTSSLADGSCRNQAGVPCVSVPTVSYQVCGNVDADLPFLEHERTFVISVFIHELMHAFGTNGNMDHFGTTVCDTAMGGEAYKDGGLFTSQHFCGMCPTVYQNFSESYAACP